MRQQSAARERAPSTWIVSPWFDLLFLANLGWLLLLVPGLVAEGRTGPLEFCQVYYLTTPHRWITLFLVLLDADRREDRAPLFLGILLAVAATVLVVRVFAEAFPCLLFIDFLWNAWHFASQHAGILRMYGRKAGAPYSWLEKHGLRIFIFYAIMRIPAWSADWLAGIPAPVRLLDLAMLGVPAALILRSLSRRDPWSSGRAAYLWSVCGLYTLIVLTRDLDDPSTANALFLGASIFHATEYLAVVTHYARRRAGQGSEGAFRTMARSWGVVLASYVLIIGTADFLAQRHSFELAASLNVGAAFLHYAYDSLIWKLRRPATAHSLGV